MPALPTLSLTAARARLGATLRELDTAHEPVLLTCRGQPVGVLLGWPQFQAMTASDGTFMARLERWRAEHLPAATGSDPFHDVRDATPGRDVPRF